MRHNRFQNHVAESVFTLPVCAVLATLLWWWPRGEYSLDYILGWALCGLATYVIAETNNTYTLVRIRTRMVSCVWLVSVTCMGFLHPLSSATISAFCLTVSYYLLFRTYQQYQPVNWTFHSFFFLSAGSLVFPQMLLLAVFNLWYILVFLRAMTGRVFWAALIGLCLPYWFWASWCLWQQDFTPIVSHFQQMVEWQPLSVDNYMQLPLAWLASWALFTLLVLVGGIHYLSTSYNDKIQVRMFLYVYVCQVVLLQAAIVLQPVHFQPLMALLLVSGSPLVAHYFALTGSWFSNAFFCLTLLAVIALAVLNLWMPSFSL